jgi:hypothetical protein
MVEPPDRSNEEGKLKKKLYTQIRKCEICSLLRLLALKSGKTYAPIMRSKYQMASTFNIVIPSKRKWSGGIPEAARISFLWQKIPIKGTASDVAGIFSATIFRKTVNDNKIVTPARKLESQS